MSKLFPVNDGGSSRAKNIQGVVWLIGIAILAATESWWPGIMVLIAVSILTKVIFGRGEPENELPPLELPTNPASTIRPDPKIDSDIIPLPSPDRTWDWIPQNCQKCGGPLTTRTIIRVSESTAQCPFCGTAIKNGG